MTRYEAHKDDRSIFVEPSEHRTIRVSIGERAYGQFQSIELTHEASAEMALWMLNVTEAPAHGDALDYLAELKGTLSALVSCHAEAQDDARDRVLRRALQLANTASNAILAERRAAR